MALVAVPVVQAVEEDGRTVYKYTAHSGVEVVSSVPNVGTFWWDRHVVFGFVGSYVLWSANIAADVGWLAPRRWVKRLDAKMTSIFL